MHTLLTLLILKVCVYTHTHMHSLYLNDFWAVYHPLIVHGNVYVKSRNNKSVAFSKPQSLSNLALSSFLQFTLWCWWCAMNPCPRCAMDERVLWQKKGFCWSNLFLFPVEAFGRGNHQVFMFLKPPPFYKRLGYNFSVLLVSDICWL